MLSKVFLAVEGKLTDRQIPDQSFPSILRNGTYLPLSSLLMLTLHDFLKITPSGSDITSAIFFPCFLG